MNDNKPWELFKTLSIVPVCFGWMFFGVYLILRVSNSSIYVTNIHATKLKMDEAWSASGHFGGSTSDNFTVKVATETKSKGVASQP